MGELGPSSAVSEPRMRVTWWARGTSQFVVLIILLAALGMVGPFSIDTVFPAFPDMERDLAVSGTALQQLISVYLLAFAAMSLFHGPISDAVGRKPVVVISTVIYIGACLGAALAPSFTVLLVFRALQGLSAGGGQIISRAMVRDLFEGERAQRVMSHIAMIFGLAPAIAPIVGGWLLGWTNWRGIFWFLFTFCAVLVIAVVALLPESHPANRRTPLRVGPLFASLQSVWSQPAARRLIVTIMLNFAGMFLYISSAPIIVVRLLGRGETDFWMLFVPLIGGMVFGSWISGRLAGRVSGRRLATAGFALSAVGALINLCLSVPDSRGAIPWAVLGLPIYTVGVAIAFPILTLTMLDLFPHNRGAASSVQSFVQLSFNAVVAGVLAPVLARSMTVLAVSSAALTMLGWLLWRGHLEGTDQQPSVTTSPAAYEPADET